MKIIVCESKTGNLATMSLAFSSCILTPIFPLLPLSNYEELLPLLCCVAASDLDSITGFVFTDESTKKIWLLNLSNPRAPGAGLPVAVFVPFLDTDLLRTLNP